MPVKYPSGIVKEEIVYECGTQGSGLCCSYCERHQHRELLMDST